VWLDSTVYIRFGVRGDYIPWRSRDSVEVLMYQSLSTIWTGKERSKLINLTESLRQRCFKSQMCIVMVFAKRAQHSPPIRPCDHPFFANTSFPQIYTSLIHAF